MFITMEAGEGAGKSTQARLLYNHLRAQGHDVVLTREPGGTTLAERLRGFVVEGAPESMDPMTEMLILAAARHDHIQRILRPALDQGKIVLCDRYLGSTHALQGAGGVPAETIDTLHDLVNGLRPDLTLFLDLDPETGLTRALDRATDRAAAEARFEAKGVEFHAKVDALYRHMAQADPTWARVDARGSIEEVQARVRTAVVTHPVFRARHVEPRKTWVE